MVLESSCIPLPSSLCYKCPKPSGVFSWYYFPQEMFGKTIIVLPFPEWLVPHLPVLPPRLRRITQHSREKPVLYCIPICYAFPHHLLPFLSPVQKRHALPRGSSLTKKLDAQSRKAACQGTSLRVSPGVPMVTQRPQKWRETPTIWLMDIPKPYILVFLQHCALW